MNNRDLIKYNLREWVKFHVLTVCFSKCFIGIIHLAGSLRVSGQGNGASDL